MAARVNGAEISIHQVNQFLKNSPGITADNLSAARKQILDKLIDEQLAVEQAGKDNIDRTPDVQMQIEAAKRQIIASAYIKKVTLESVKISDEDTKTYYQEHPALFSDRKIYTLQDIGVQRSDDINSILTDDFIKQKSKQDLEDWLKSHHANFSIESYVRPAEQVPLDMLTKLAKLNAGDVTILDLNDIKHVIFVINTKQAPVAYSDSAALIKTFLFNTKAKPAAIDNLKKLREQSNIQYFGEFDPKSASDSKLDISKGVAGLK
ncbi:hypothetical protein ZMTM_04950 [Methyloradius palustris]|uniref:PpiC domain-containing protein n=1 Tax=Methyloradius palustris TaxID=2778876 RepID=A0A8D5JQ78_9PROT|nr:hypothetical protein ZMTM_04950 [Methyloradius palustris]